MFEPLGVTWVGLFAEDLQALQAFYVERVGFKVIEADDTCCLLDAGAGSHFEIWSKGTAPAVRKTVSEQSMLVGFRVERLEPVVDELRQRGVFPVGPIDSYQGSRWIHYVDPEGNRFELKDFEGL